MINWQNLVKIFDKAKQYHGVKKVFLLFFEMLFLHLCNEEWTKQTNFKNFNFKSAFSKKRFPFTVYWSHCYGALQNSYNYPEVVFHENYGKPKPFQNDIALIKLDGEVKTTEFNTARIANAAQITLWLSGQDLSFSICE